MDNKKAEIKKVSRMGQGVFAKANIKKDELIAEWDGPVYDYDFPTWTQDMINHVIQFEKRKWRDSQGIARYLNHSCDPNCGIRGLFQIVAMRDIKRGEELTWDYEMTENYKWRMKCRCGSPLCRKVIGAYDNMPQDIRKKYKGYISEWLTK